MYLNTAEFGSNAYGIKVACDTYFKKSPSEINYRANIDCLKQLEVTDIISLSAVGSLRDELDPETFVIVDQFIDRTIN